MELATGVLALREPGGPNHASTGLGPPGLPRTFASGRMLASPGGYVRGIGREVRAEELPAACVEELLAGGGTWSKVIADWIDADGAFTPNFPPEALAAAAAAVHAVGGRITAHVTLPATTEMVIEAGFDCIEHGDGITDAAVAKLAAAGMDWVPTLAIGVSVMPFVRSLGATEGEVRRLTGSIEDLPRAVRLGSEAGVRILAGTDSGMLPHGQIALEITSLAAAGLSTEAALAAGSWTGRAFLGLPGIEHGAPADLVAYAGDPRDDLAILAEPLLIVLDGTVVGGTLAHRAR
jgi:imidazolonepropionase-like amidohydrolase